MVTILTGLQGGYIKYCYSQCEWDTRAKEVLYQKRLATPADIAASHSKERNKFILPPLQVGINEKHCDN